VKIVKLSHEEIDAYSDELGKLLLKKCLKESEKYFDRICTNLKCEAFNGTAEILVNANLILTLNLLNVITLRSNEQNKKEIPLKISDVLKKFLECLDVTLQEMLHKEKLN
jgi:hypothetical protein